MPDAAPNDPQHQTARDREEAAKAMRFLAIKAAIFIGIPLMAAAAAALAIVLR